VSGTVGIIQFHLIFCRVNQDPQELQELTGSRYITHKSCSADHVSKNRLFQEIISVIPSCSFDFII